MKEVYVIGGGLAGSEAAWQLLQRGIKVTMFEMRGVQPTPAHHTDKLAELVCSNSFRSDDVQNAVGLLHQEMRMLNSLIMNCADKTKVPAGSALAVDREEFSATVQSTLLSHENFTLVRKEIAELPNDILTIIATGPLSSAKLTAEFLKYSGEEYLAFFDAIAPIVFKDSINFNISWMQSRYDKGEGSDYINCPMNREQYYTFVDELLKGEKTEFKDWEKDTPYFDGCLPIEVMIERGAEVLRFGPMKPVGLTNPHSPDKPYAVVQLRQDNKQGTLYNIVGFQTKLKYNDQQRIFRMIPGLENAEFARLGGLHRNTFINSPTLLDEQLRFKKLPNIRMAGQITGVEGYLESAAIGMLAGLFAAHEVLEENMAFPPRDSALGSLLSHITGEANPETFQPMNINYGLFPPLVTKHKKVDRKKMYSDRAIASVKNWKKTLNNTY